MREDPSLKNLFLALVKVVVCRSGCCLWLLFILVVFARCCVLAVVKTTLAVI